MASSAMSLYGSLTQPVLLGSIPTFVQIRRRSIKSDVALVHSRLYKCYGVITLAVSGTGTNIMQKLFTLAMSGTRIAHLKVFEITLKHTN